MKYLLSALTTIFALGILMTAPPARATNPFDQLDDRVDSLEEATILQQEQIDQNARKWTLMDGDDPPKPIGEITYFWYDYVEFVMEIEGHILAGAAYPDRLNAPTIYYSSPGCTGQAYTYAYQSRPTFTDIFLVHDVSNVGIIRLYVSTGPPAQYTRRSYFNSNGGSCYTWSTGYSATGTAIELLDPTLDMAELYPPPYTVVKQ